MENSIGNIPISEKDKIKKEIESLEKELEPLFKLWEKAMRRLNNANLTYLTEEKEIEEEKDRHKKIREEIDNDPDFKKMFELNDKRKDLLVKLENINKNK